MDEHPNGRKEASSKPRLTRLQISPAAFARVARSA